jgi:hypothetical protein
MFISSKPFPFNFPSQPQPAQIIREAVICLDPRPIFRLLMFEHADENARMLYL